MSLNGEGAVAAAAAAEPLEEPSPGRPSPDNQPFLAKSKPNHSGGLSSTELFISRDPNDLKQNLRLTRIASKVATHISRALGPEEILEWVSASVKQIWSDDPDIEVRVCLQETFAPEDFNKSRWKMFDTDDDTGVVTPLPKLQEDCDATPNDFFYLDVAALGSLSGSPRADGGRRCQWFGATSHSLLSEWKRLDIQQHHALRRCYERVESVSDHGGPGNWAFPEHAEAGPYVSFLYFPLSVRDERLGVLRLASSCLRKFAAASRATFTSITEVAAVHLQALHMRWDMDCRRRAVELDRARHEEVAAAYRELLNDMLPSHIVDELSVVQSPSPNVTSPDSEMSSAGTASNFTEAPEDFPHSSSMDSRNELEPEDGRSQPEAEPCDSFLPVLPSAMGRKERRLHSGTIPANVTAQLDKLTYAEYHECVAILFSDVKGFTKLSEESDPAEVMLMLDDLFGRFDTIVEKHAPVAYKVETIGDAYMIAFGLFGQTCFDEDTPTDYAVSVHAIAVGAEMIMASREVMTPPGSGLGKPVEIRVGVQFGQIMSGIIGKKVPRYCMFGDTVNTASRMESMGVPGMIHVTQSVQRACKEGRHGDLWLFRSTGAMKVKGKGHMRTFLLDPEQVLDVGLHLSPEPDATQGPRSRLGKLIALQWGEKARTSLLYCLAVTVKALCAGRSASGRSHTR